MDDLELAKLAESTYHAKAAPPPRGTGDVIAAWVAVVEEIRTAILTGEPTMRASQFAQEATLDAPTGTGWCAPSP